MDDNRGRKEIQPSLGAFGQRRYEPSVWSGGEGTGDDIDFIGPSIAVCPRRHVVTRIKDTSSDRIKFFDDTRNYGYTTAGIFVHGSDILTGNPVPGAKLTYEVKESAKGKRAVNVKVG